MRSSAVLPILIVALLTVSLAGPLIAGPFEDAVSALNRGDYVTAYKLHKVLAEQGNRFSQYNLGVMYYLGQGVPQDYAEAAKWHRKSAEQGASRAQFDLGVMYYRGHGVPQDYVLAHMWFNLAASRYMASEEDDRKSAIKNRDITASKMTPTQIAEAQKMAREWKPKKEGK